MGEACVNALRGIALALVALVAVFACYLQSFRHSERMCPTKWRPQVPSPAWSEQLDGWGVFDRCRKRIGARCR